MVAMVPITRRTASLMLAALFLPPLARRGAARPVRYRLDPAGSRVAFTFRMAGLMQTGTMPVRAAGIFIDPANLAASRVDVTLDAAAARAGPDYATAAMHSPGVLDTARFPTIRFRSTRATPGPDGRLSGGASLRGLLTIRDVTRPVVLAAALYRPRGSAADALGSLTVHLGGEVSRRAFGATGYAEIVADTVGLDIRARIVAE